MRTTTTRGEYITRHFHAASAESPLLDAGYILRKLGARYDALHAMGLTDCSAECNPGNCEAAHREAVGWDEVERAAKFERDLPGTA